MKTFAKSDSSGRESTAAVRPRCEHGASSGPELEAALERGLSQGRDTELFQAQGPLGSTEAFDWVEAHTDNCQQCVWAGAAVGGEGVKGTEERLKLHHLLFQLVIQEHIVNNEFWKGDSDA